MPHGQELEPETHAVCLTSMLLRTLAADPGRDLSQNIKLGSTLAKESDVVVAQVENNTREQAMKGNLPGAVQQAVVRALGSHQKLATQVLKADRQGMATLNDVVYDLMRHKKLIDPDDLNA